MTSSQVAPLRLCVFALKVRSVLKRKGAKTQRRKNVLQRISGSSAFLSEIPEGRTRIAQRFNAGSSERKSKSRRDGRNGRSILVRRTKGRHDQPSLRDLVHFHSLPGVETPGYFHAVPPGRHLDHDWKVRR